MKLKEIISDFLENFILFFIFLVAFSVLFFIPNSPFVLLSKQYFLIGVSLLLLIFWTGWVLINKKFHFIGKGLTYLFPILFIIGALISAIFSQYRHGSFWGSETWSLSFISLAALVIIFFVAINYLNKEKFKKYLFIFISSVALSQIIYIFFVLKVFSFTWLPANLIGHNISMAYLSSLSVITCLSLFIYYLNSKKKILQKILLPIYIVLSIIVILIVSHWNSWLLIIIGSVLLLTFYFIRQKKLSAKVVSLPIMLIIISIIFWAIGGIDFIQKVNIEVLPNYRTSFAVAQGSFAEYPLQGTGINNYSISYNLFRPESVNNTSFWSETFYFSYNKYFDLWSTGGLVVILPYLALLIYFSIRVIKALISKKEDDYVLPLGVVWLAIVIGNFLFISNLIISVFSWFILAGIIIYTIKPTVIKKKTYKQKNILIIIIALVLFVASVIGLSLSVKRFVAAQAFFQARKYAFDIDMQPQIDKWLKFAARWDKNNDNYHRQLANFYVLSLKNLKMMVPDEDSRIEYESNLQDIIEKANTEVAKSIEANPRNFLNYLTAADFYSSTIGLVSNSYEWIDQSLTDALDSFPNNVFLIDQLAKSQHDHAREWILVKSNLDQQDKDTTEIDQLIMELLNLSKENATSAINLKQDYWPAHYTLALVEWELGNFDQAIVLLENLQQKVPNDIGVKFYLAIIYDQKGDTEKAIDLLSKTVDLAPTFSDGYWTLASIYQRLGQLSNARESLEKILEYDPQNKTVNQALDNLGRAIETDIEFETIEGPSEEDIE